MFQNFSVSAFQVFRILGCLILGAQTQLAQTIVVPPGREARPSLAGETAAAALANSLRPQDYSIRIGGWNFQARGSFEVEYNDNVYWTQLNPKADLVLHPRIDLDTYWRMTELNTLTLNLGLRYEYYLDNQGLNPDAPLLSPRSELAFNFFVGDFRFRIRDRFYFDETLSQNVQLLEGGEPFINFNNIELFSRFDNKVGISVDWDLHDVILSGSYDHDNYVSLTERWDYLTRASEQFALSASLYPDAPFRPGLQSSFSLNNYKLDTVSDQFRFSVGPTASFTVSRFLTLQAGAGYQLVQYDDPAASGVSALNTFYAYGQANHRAKPWFTQSFRVGQFNDLGWQCGNVETISLSYNAEFTCFRNTTITTYLSYNLARQTGGTSNEDYSYFLPRVRIDYDLNKRWDTWLSYGFTFKNSDLLFRDYTQNRITLGVGYRF